MKRLLVLVLVAVGLAVPVAAHAAATTQTVPLDLLVTACNGDTIRLTGQLLIVSTATSTPSGGFVTSVHFQPQGVSGTDLQTGTKFVGTGVTRDIVISSPAGGLTETFVNQFRVQATRGAESYIISALFHVTVDANGNVKAFVDRASATC